MQQLPTESSCRHVKNQLQNVMQDAVVAQEHVLQEIPVQRHMQRCVLSKAYHNIHQCSMYRLACPPLSRRVHTCCGLHAGHAAVCYACWTYILQECNLSRLDESSPLEDAELVIHSTNSDADWSYLTSLPCSAHFSLNLKCQLVSTLVHQSRP